MKKISLFLFVLMILSACAPVATQTSEVPDVLEVRPTTTTIEILVTPSPEPTATPESTGIQFKEVNIKTIEEYNAKMLYDLNHNSPYFKELGIASYEDLERVLKENNGFLPASKESNRIKYVTFKHISRLEPTSIAMDMPLKVDPVFDIVTPDQKDEKKIYPAITYPWYFDRSNLEPPPQDKSVSIGIGIQNTGGHNEIVFQLVWNNTDFDFFGNKVSTPPPNSVLIGQADSMFRMLMYSGRTLSQSMLDNNWWTKHKPPDGFMGNKDSLLIITAYKYIIEQGEIINITGPTDTIEFPDQTIE